ncbi:MAG: SEC-C domain-containing protein [Deltaproteobacteria bacterium]|nr:SEC-C domain-containing protein [Deltaproteobacteria bacterium]
MSNQPEEAPKLGRNDPCWCGSGKKYKKCHLESDLRKQRFGASSCKAPA